MDGPLRLELRRPSDLAGMTPGAIRGAVVVDLFRATSTLQTLIESRHAVRVVATYDLARQALREGSRCVGEWLGETPPGFSAGNSPLHARALEPGPVVFLSSNGAGALTAASRVTNLVLAANLFNLDAVARLLLGSPGRWLLVPAGLRGEPCLEDDYVCARLARRLAPVAVLGGRLRRAVEDVGSLTVADLSRCDGARRLLALGPEGKEDLAFILGGEFSTPNVPVLVSASGAMGLLQAGHDRPATGAIA